MKSTLEEFSDLLWSSVGAILENIYQDTEPLAYLPHAKHPSTYVLSPFPTLIFVLAFNSGQRDLMDLHVLTPYGVVTSLVIQLSSSTYFWLNDFLPVSMFFIIELPLPFHPKGFALICQVLYHIIPFNQDVALSLTVSLTEEFSSNFIQPIDYPL